MRYLLLDLNKQIGKFEVIVVDDASTDNTEEIVKEVVHLLKYRLIYVKLKNQIGLPSARNIGISNSNSEIIGFLDDDCIPIRNDLLIRAYKWLKLNKYKIVGVGGPIYLRKSKSNNEKLKLEYVTTLRGGNCFYLKVYVQKCGGFDIKFDGNFFREDTDFSISIRKFGRLILDPKMPVNHLMYNSGGCRRDINDFYLNLISNTILLILKHKKINIDVIFDSIYHLFNYFKVFTQNNNENIEYYQLKKFNFFKTIKEGFFLGIKKYFLPKMKQEPIILYKFDFYE